MPVPKQDLNLFGRIDQCCLLPQLNSYAHSFFNPSLCCKTMDSECRERENNMHIWNDWHLLQVHLSSHTPPQSSCLHHRSWLFLNAGQGNKTEMVCPHSEGQKNSVKWDPASLSWRKDIAKGSSPIVNGQMASIAGQGSFSMSPQVLLRVEVEVSSWWCLHCSLDSRLTDDDFHL